MAKDSKAFVGCWLPKEVHRALNSLASRLGQDIPDVAADLIEAGITEQLEYLNGTSDDVSAELALAQTYMKMRRHEQIRHQLVSLMISVIQMPVDDKQVEAVIHLCEVNGFDIEEIRLQAQEMTRTQTSGIFRLDEQDTQTGRASTFLAELFRNANSLSAKDIERRALQQNIPMNVLKIAKRQLGLVSVRKGNSWRWELPYLTAPSSVQVKL